MNRLSGDQKAWLDTSVPGIGRALRESIERIQSCGHPSAPMTVKTNFRPSGEMKSVAPEKDDFSGGKM
jgi:hypothetical protein